MRVFEYEIEQDGETVVVRRVGFNEKKQIETFTPVAYVRDLLGALEAVERRVSASALSKAADFKSMKKLLEKQHKELISIVKAVKTFPSQKDET